LIPCVCTSNARCVWLLPCNLQNVSETVVVESAHGVQVGRECITTSGFQLLDEVFYIGGDDLFRCLPLLRLFGVWVDWLSRQVVAIADRFMGAFSLVFAFALTCRRGMYLHAERLLAKAGVARRNGEGYLPPERSEWRSAAKVCTSEARKTAGNPLRRAIGAEPLSEACLPYCVRNARQISGSALRAGTGPPPKENGRRRAAGVEG
jgi:hypothetical protein